MLTAFAKAVAQLLQPELRRPLILTLGWTLLIFVAIWLGGFALFGWLHGHWSLTPALGRLGGDAVTALGAMAGIAVWALATWLLFVSVENAVLSCYADRIAAAVERRYYPALPPPAAAGWHDALRSSLRLTLISVIGNILALPFYLVPGLNLVLFLALNGYLLGRTYFDAVALRRMEDRNARRVWRAHRLGFVLNGALSAALLTIPLLNLVVPILGLATAVHLFEQLRPRSAESA